MKWYSGQAWRWSWRVSADTVTPITSVVGSKSKFWVPLDHDLTSYCGTYNRGWKHTVFLIPNISVLFLGPIILRSRLICSFVSQKPWLMHRRLRGGISVSLDNVLCAILSWFILFALIWGESLCGGHDCGDRMCSDLLFSPWSHVHLHYSA